MTTARSFALDDSAGKLMALGFVPSTEFPGFEMKIDSIRISASISFDSVLIRGTFHTAREMGELDVRVPAHAPLRAYAEGLIKIVTNFCPQYVNRNLEAANRHLRMVELSRPHVQVSRALLRRNLKDLKTRIKDVPVPDARLDYHDNVRTGQESVLSIAVGHQLMTIPATGLWVGRIWVKSRDLFKALDRRFQTDPVGIRLYSNHDTAGQWLCIGNQSMRADWETPLESTPGKPIAAE
jgi:hypothetical protein